MAKPVEERYTRFWWPNGVTLIVLGEHGSLTIAIPLEAHGGMKVWAGVANYDEGRRMTMYGEMSSQYLLSSNVFGGIIKVKEWMEAASEVIEKMRKKTDMVTG